MAAGRDAVPGQNTEVCIFGEKLFRMIKNHMSEEFTQLQNLIKEGKAELLLKKSWRKSNIFGIWLDWYCDERPSILNL